MSIKSFAHRIFGVVPAQAPSLAPSPIQSLYAAVESASIELSEDRSAITTARRQQSIANRRVRESEQYSVDHAIKIAESLSAAFDALKEAQLEEETLAFAEIEELSEACRARISTLQAARDAEIARIEAEYALLQNDVQDETHVVIASIANKVNADRDAVINALYNASDVYTDALKTATGS